MSEQPLRRSASRKPMIRHECEKCGETMESYKRVGRCVDDRCNGEMVAVQYVPRAVSDAADNFKVAVIDALRMSKGDERIERIWTAVEEFNEAVNG